MGSEGGKDTPTLCDSALHHSRIPASSCPTISKPALKNEKESNSPAPYVYAPDDPDAEGPECEEEEVGEGGWGVGQTGTFEVKRSNGRELTDG